VHINPADIIHRIGAMPIGDPAAMRSHAVRLNADADTIMSLVQAAHGRGHATAYLGPAADRFRADLEVVLRDVQRRVAHLHHAADALMRAAGDVEVAQHQWHTLYTRVESDLVAAAKAALDHH
jgi:hypothetical protein